MNDFRLSLADIYNRYKLELLVLGIAGIFVALSAIMYLSAMFDNNAITLSTDIDEENIQSTPSGELRLNTISVEVSGAVYKPGVYTVSKGTRLDEVIALSGGLSPDADEMFFARNVNLAKVTHNQEKIHVPFSSEIQQGIFHEKKRYLEYLAPEEVEELIDTATNKQGSISINTATISELTSLKGIGEVTAKKIIDNRPYSSVTELKDKQILNASVYASVESLIQL